MPSKGRPVQDRNLRTQEAILSSAVELFRVRGYDGTAVQDIVDRAEVTKGAFYYSFGSKLDVLRRIHDRFLDHVIVQVEQIREESTDPAEALRSVIRSLMATVAKFQPEVTIFVQESRFLEENGYESVREKRDHLTFMLVEILEQGVVQKRFKTIDDPQVLAFGIIGMCSWAYQWYRPKYGPLDSVADLYSRVVLNGLLTPNAR